MEPSWIRPFRGIAKQQAGDVVDAKIVNHRMQLKRRDGQVIDAGPIKVKPPGALVHVGQYPPPNEPDIYVTRDGVVWHSGASESRYQDGTGSYVDSACWTGDRFMVPIYVFDDNSTMLQSRDGGTWSFHPDRETFNPAFTNGNIYCMDATGDGLVVLAGYFLGPDHASAVAFSHDFGETWTVLDSSVTPFAVYGLYGVCVKNDYEWVVHDGVDASCDRRHHFVF